MTSKNPAPTATNPIEDRRVQPARAAAGAVQVRPTPTRALQLIRSILQTSACSGKKPTVADLNQILGLIDGALKAPIVTPDPATTFGPLSEEDAQDYLAGWLGKNDLSVGPNMLAWALDSMLQRLAAERSAK